MKKTKFANIKYLYYIILYFIIIIIYGLHRKIDDLKRLIHKYSPLIICLQDTNFL